MTLSTSIRGKSESDNLATAIPAIAATQQQASARTVARIATVAVANSQGAQKVNPALTAKTAAATATGGNTVWPLPN